jgi:hypothetical protein
MFGRCGSRTAGCPRESAAVRAAQPCAGLQPLQEAICRRQAHRHGERRRRPLALSQGIGRQRGHDVRLCLLRRPDD